MKGLLPVLLASAALALPAYAQNATTTPVGAMTYSFPATTSASDSLTYLTLPLTTDTILTAKPTAVGSNTLTVSGANWTPNQFQTTPPSFFIRVMSGLQQGRILKVLSNTSDTLTVSINDDTSVSTALNLADFAVTTSDTLGLYPADTLASLFGDNISVNGTISNQLIFAGATRIGSSDTVSVLSKTTSTSTAYWFSTSSNFWKSSTGTANMNNEPVFPDTAIAILRRKNRPATSFTLVGNVSTVPTLQKSIYSRAVPASLIFPVDMPLSSLQIGGGWTKSTRIGSADTLSIYNPSSGKFDAYFQKPDSSWRLSTNVNVDASSLVIPAGAVVSLLERTNNLVGSGSFFTISLPYTLN